MTSLPFKQWKIYDVIVVFIWFLGNYRRGQTPHFTRAESNANEGERKGFSHLHSIRLMWSMAFDQNLRTFSIRPIFVRIPGREANGIDISFSEFHSKILGIPCETGLKFGKIGIQCNWKNSLLSDHSCSPRVQFLRTQHDWNLKLFNIGARHVFFICPTTETSYFNIIDSELATTSFTKQCENTCKLLETCEWPRGGTPLYGLYRYVRPQGVWFFSRFGHK